jgi:tetratricopeptide (TPR) repeat protein
VSLSLNAGRLEQLFNYQRMRTGVRQPSLLRNAKVLRERALEEVDRAIAEGADSAAVLRRKGDILFDLGRITRAVELYAEAEEKGPADGKWYFRTAGRLEMAGRLSAAAQVLESAAARPEEVTGGFGRLALLELGRLYDALGRLDEAATAYRRALESLSAAPIGRRTPMEQAFAERIAQDPTSIRRILATILTRQGKHEEAVGEARKAIATAPNDSRALRGLIDAYIAADRREEAIEAARTFSEENPASRSGVLALMKLLEQADRIDQATDAGKAFLAENPADARVRSEIIALYRKAGRAEEAESFALGEETTSDVGYQESLALLDVYAQSKDEHKAFDLALKILEEHRLDTSAALQVVAKLYDVFPRDSLDAFRSDFARTHEKDYRVDYAFARVIAGKGDAQTGFEIFHDLARKGAPYGDVYEKTCAWLLSERKVVEAAVVLLDGTENGFVARPGIFERAFVEAAVDPLDAAASVEGLMPNYDSALTALYEIVAGLYSAGGNDAAAETYYRKALENPIARLSNYGGLALSLYRQGKTAEAIALIEGLIGKGQGAPPLVRMLVGLLSGDGRTEEARRLAAKLIAESPTNIDNRLALVGILIDEEKYADAEDELLVTKNLAEGDHESLMRVRYYLGIVYEEQGRDALALSMWRANLTVDPENADAHNAIAYHYAQAGENLQKALEYVNKALESDPENAAYLDTLGWVLYKMGDYEGAVKHLRRAAAKMSDAVIFDHLGDALLGTGDTEGAVSAWRKALTSSPKASDRAAIEEKIEANSPEPVEEAPMQSQGEDDGGS